ncbi:MAG TPA: hypothetical protein VJA46_10280 [Acidimicrobiia bacterium]|nr:hypothetical protein [Acidimicrobiia bacterium]
MTLPRRVGPAFQWPTFLIIAGISLVVLIVLNPGWILSATTPTGGDMGAHVFGPAYLRDHLLPEGRILGWSNDWFAGFPAFYFYFPLPSLVIVLLDVVLPYGVAFKVVTVIGLLGIPPAAYYLSRAMLLGRHVSIVAAGSGAVFAFLESYSIYGGNVASTLAGEFAYSWSFALSLLYLGLLIRAVREDKKYMKWAALALAATLLSHVLTSIVVVFASLFVLPWRRGFWRTLAIGFWGFAIAAFWAVPLVARIGLTSDMAWSPLTRWEEVFPVELWLLIPVAIPGAIWASRHTSRSGPLMAATLLPLIYFPLPTVLPELFPGLFGGERWKLWNGRLLPYWYFGVAFFAAVGVGAAAVWASRRLPSRVSAHWARLLVAIATVVAASLVADSADFPAWAWIPVAMAGAGLVVLSFFWAPDLSTRHFLTTAVTSVIVMGALAGVTFIDGWSKWNFEGYESKQPWPEYEALMAQLDRLPDGRVHWEANNDALNRYGTPMSPMLIPYWTEGSQKSMEGLYFESSLTTPFHFINSSEMSEKPSNPIPGLTYHTGEMERGIKHLELYGVSYYVSVTPEATAKADAMPELTKLATTTPFTIYALPKTGLVEPASFLPSVYEVDDRGLLALLTGHATVTDEEGVTLPSFYDMSLEWYDDVENLGRWVVADGPEEWPRIESLDERPNQTLQVPADAVSDVVVEDHRISFHTTAVGVPHLVKVSYFPNWTAEGADGPWRAAPSLMVVVPTSEEVTLEFRDTWAESGGLILSGVGIVVLLGVGVAAVRRRKIESGPGSAGSA